MTTPVQKPKDETPAAPVSVSWDEIDSRAAKTAGTDSIIRSAWRGSLADTGKDT